MTLTSAASPGAAAVDLEALLDAAEEALLDAAVLIPAATPRPPPTPPPKPPATPPPPPPAAPAGERQWCRKCKVVFSSAPRVPAGGRVVPADCPSAAGVCCPQSHAAFLYTAKIPQAADAVELEVVLDAAEKALQMTLPVWEGAAEDPDALAKMLALDIPED
jgi:hypothetical protein